MRNRFISDYIHRTTGKYRSAKQVGSRLQQLRDTAEGRECKCHLVGAVHVRTTFINFHYVCLSHLVIDVLTRCYRTRMDAGTCNARVFESHPTPSNLSPSPSSSTISCDSSSTSSSSDSLATPTSPVIMPRLPPLQSRQPLESRMPVYIDILPQQLPWSPMTHGPSSISASSTSHSDPRASDAVRHISNIDPTVTFVSPSPVNGKSSYIVLLDGAPVHSEDTELEYAGPYYSSSAGRAPGNGPVLYNTALVPKYWGVLCKAAGSPFTLRLCLVGLTLFVDPTLYTIVQEVYYVPDSVPNQNYSQRPRPVRIFSATYHFRYPSATDAPPMNVQPPTALSSSSSSMTSTFNDKMPHAPMDLAPTTSFPMTPMYTAPAAEGLGTPTEVDQNLFDEPFMLDVNFDQLAFDEIFVNMDTSDGAFSSSFFS